MSQSKLLIELHALGWRGFQDLSGEILKRTLGQSFMVFADSNDAGRDGAFYGDWDDTMCSKNPTGIKSGATVLQCKFSAKPDSTLSLSTLDEELGKVARLVENNLCDNYILMTNSRVTGKSEEIIVKALKEKGVKSVYVLDGNWICGQIISHQSLRLYVPRVYGLGDLSQIIDERSYRQAKELLDQLEGLSTFVITKSYIKAADAIHKEGFVLLLGEPSSGKSVIAATLAMASADSNNSLVVRIAKASEFKTHWNPDESENQFFWIDDAFGAIVHDESFTDMWSKTMPEVMAAIKKGAKVVMTSRDYIYRDAKPLLKEYAFPLLRESQVVINVQNLTEDEKKQILYNHIKLGNQTSKFKKTIKPYLEDVASVRKFLPEVARRFGNRTFTKNLTITSKKAVIEFMEKPKEYLADIYGELSDAQKAAMALVYKYTNLPSPIRQSVKDTDLLDRFGTNLNQLQKALKALDGGFMRHNETKNVWSFHHPTLREGYASYIMNDPELLDVLLDGFEIETLLDSITCEGKSRENGQLINIPRSYYNDIISRLGEFKKAYDKADNLTHYYLRVKYFELLKRSEINFLTMVMKTYGKYINEILKFGLSGSILGNASISMAYHLKQADLLDEQLRQEVVSFLSEAAIRVPDSNWATWKPAKSLITDGEGKAIERRVRVELISNLNDTINEWEENENDEVEDYYEDLIRTLDEYSDIFFDDDTAQLLLDDGKQCIVELKKELEKKQKQLEDGALYDDRDSVAPLVTLQRRSVFDDIDL
jgi:hypothetical protein